MRGGSPLKLIVSGPGTYESLGVNRRGNMMTTKDNRFRDKKSDNPGPGAYEVNNNMVKKFLLV